SGEGNSPPQGSPKHPVTDTGDTGNTVPNFGSDSPSNPSVPQNNGDSPGKSNIESNINNDISNAIAQLYPGSSPPNGNPSQPQNPSSPGDSGSNAIISNVLGSYIASIFSGSSSENPGNPGNPGTPGSNVPSQGQVDGISYSVGSSQIVVDGKTYSPAAPTVVTLPNGQTANIGPNGLSIGNNFVPINPGGNPGSPSQGNINGVPYSLTPNGIVVSGTTYSTSQPTSVTLPNGQNLVIGPGGTVQIGGTTVPTFSQSGNTNGVSYTITPSGIVISGTTYPLSQPTSVTLPNGQTLVIGPNGVVQIGGTTIQVPTSGTFNGISYSITPSGSIVINGQTLSPSTPTSITLPGGHVVTIGPNGLVIDGTTVPVTLGSSPTSAKPQGMGVTTAISTGSITTSGSTVSSTGSSSKTSSSSRSSSSTSAASASKTAAPKKAAGTKDRDLMPLGTVLVI
ncbi:hypothetical protein GP486_008358, partial [Trichoglossum hirsutum]